MFKEGDYITITEKIDGTNASFTLDEENTLGVSCYSRNKLLDEENTLQGFYIWVNENIVPIKDKLDPNYKYIGKWSVKNKVTYKKECYKQFYLFSIWYNITGEYLSDEIIIKEANRLGLKTVPYFFIRI